jgi:hypothetical protein
MKAKLKEDWKPRWLTRMGDGWERPAPRFNPLLTNHQRMLQRKANREQLRKSMEKTRKHVGA